MPVCKKETENRCAVPVTQLRVEVCMHQHTLLPDVLPAVYRPAAACCDQILHQVLHVTGGCRTCGTSQTAALSPTDVLSSLQHPADCCGYSSQAQSVH
jgi:hypothetical protein